MKYLLLTAISLFAFNSFAGAGALSCYDSSNNLVMKRSLESKSVKTALSFNDMKTDKYSIDVSYNSATHIMNYVIYEMNSGLDLDSGETEVVAGEKVQFVSGYYCVVQ